MEFRVLGRVEALAGDRSLPLGPFKQRALLAVLLIHRNEVVSSDRIIDELWGPGAAPDRHNALWVLISNLRSALEPDRERGSEGSLIHTRAPGYVLTTELGSVDSERFEALIGEGTALLDADPAAASVVFGEALALWRGHPYEEFTYEPFAEAEITRLEEARLSAVEARFDAELTRGRARDLVGELQGLVRQHPTRERLAGQLMLALYRSGRQAEALRVFRSLEARLGQELGIEPSVELQRLEEKIVLSDPALATLEAPLLPGDAGPSGPSVRGYEIREEIREDAFGVTFRAYQPTVGRQVAVKVIKPEVADAPDFIRLFEGEVHAVARLEQPNILPIYDYWREPGAAYLVTRLMPRSLKERLVDGPLEMDEAARIVQDIGGALEATHRCGIAHRDLQTADVLLDDSGHAYLADFGVAVGVEDVGDMAASVEKDIQCFATIVAEALTGRSGDVAELRVGLDAGVAQVIGDATDADGGACYGDVGSFTQALLAALDEAGSSVAPRPVEGAPNPYKGLRPFEQADAADFFGRDRLIDRLVARLGRPGKPGRFVAVVGPSGSGKSSLVKAGLLPALRQDAAPGSSGWYQIEVVPGRHPFEELEKAMVAIAVEPPASLLEHLTGKSGIRTAADRVMPDDHSQLLIVVDQLEELFTQAAPERANRFLQALADAVTAEHSRVRVVVTLRADFYDRPLHHRRFGELLREATEIVTPMSPEELEQAITSPARRCGVSFDTAVVVEMVSDVAKRPTALPLLQYALTELFDKRTGTVIGADDYQQIGGVPGALADRAEGLYRALDDDARESARQIFLRLVTLREGVEDTRRRVLQSEVAALEGVGPRAEEVLDTFGRHRLLSFDRDPVSRGPTVEVSHEALLREWARLRDWIDDARSDVDDQRRLAQATSEWVSSGRDPDFLVRGPHHDRLAAWAETTTLTMSTNERAFLSACAEERDRSRAAAAEREHRREEAERRSRVRARLLATAIVVAALLAALGAYAFVQRGRAQDAAVLADRTTQAVRLADQANRADDPRRAVLLALQATELAAEPGEPLLPQIEEALHLAFQKARLTYPVGPGPSALRSAAPVATVVGRDGLVGVYALPPADLVHEMAAYLGPGATDALDLDLSAVPSGLRSPSDLSDNSAPATTAALAGTKVSVAGTWDEAGGLFREWERFEQETGIVVDYRPAGAPKPMDELVAQGAVPDVMWWSGPGTVASFSREWGVVDLEVIMDPRDLTVAFGDYLLELVTVDGTIAGLPIQVDVKGLVWYPKGEFAAAGYEVPESMSDLLNLSRTMIAEGRTPWCLGFEAGSFDGWPGTDWIEGLLLRTGGVDEYDRWTTHEIPFDSPAAMTAGELFDQIVMMPGAIYGGPESVSKTNYESAGEPMFQDDEPGCWMYYLGDFYVHFLPSHVDPNRDLGIFPLPPLVAGETAPTLGGGVYATATNDRPEVRELLRYLSAPEWGEAWLAYNPQTLFLSPNIHFNTDAYGESGWLKRDIGDVLQTSLEADAYRFDGSDLMPREIGGVSGALGQPGAFWQGMLDYVNGTQTIDQVMHYIETRWVELERTGQ